MKDYLVLIIDSTSIEAIVAGKTVATKHFSIREKTSSAHMEHAMITALTTVLQNIVRQHATISKIHIVLASPWIVSKTKTSNFTYAKPLMIDREYLDRIIQEERNAFKKIFAFDIEFVEQKVFETKINGYNARLTKPVPSISLTISSAMSAMSKNIVKKVIDSVDHFFHGVKVSFHSSAILTYISMRHIQPEIDSGVFIHIHGECTDITIFKNGSPTHFASMNFGSHSLVQSLAETMKTSEGVAESKISIFEKEELSAQAEEKISPLIEVKLDEWEKSISELIMQLDNKLPRNVIIHSNMYLTLFSNTLANAKEDIDITNIPDEMNALYLTGVELVEFHT